MAEIRIESTKMRVPPLALLAICAVLVAALTSFAPVMWLNVPTWLVSLELVAGVVFLLPAVVSFLKHKTTVSPLSPSDATTLVTTGIFSVTRNPMYVGMLLLLIAFAFWFQALSGLIAVVLFFLIIDRLQIKAEEKQLLKIFGSAYRDYAQRVPRWLIIRGGVVQNG